MRYKKLAIISGIILAALLLSYLFLKNKAESLLFYPDSVNYGGSPAQQNLEFEVVTIESSDGIQLNGWFIPAVTNEEGLQDANLAKGTVIHVHGNAANITNHWSLISWLPKAGYNVLTFDYRGYGQSDLMQPTIKGLYEDTTAVMNFVLKREDVHANNIFVLGQSLGGNNALAALAKMPVGRQKKICSAVIDSTFYSYSTIANDKLSGSGVLLGNEYSANNSLAELHNLPILFLHGKADHVIPFHHSEQLYALQKENRALILVEGAGHLAALYQPAFGEEYTNQILEFLKSSAESCLSKP